MQFATAKTSKDVEELQVIEKMKQMDLGTESRYLIPS